MIINEIARILEKLMINYIEKLIWFDESIIKILEYQ